MAFQESVTRVTTVLEQCEKAHVALPENQYESIREASSALAATQGQEEDAVKRLTEQLGAQPTSSTSNKRTHHELVNSDQQNLMQEQQQHQQGAEGKELQPPHKRAHLAAEIRKAPAKRGENQKLVDVFTTYGEAQLAQGHSGKGVSHLKAARALRDYDQVVTSASTAEHVALVGPLLAHQVEQVLQTGAIHEENTETETQSSSLPSSPHSTQRHHSRALLEAIRGSPATRAENQKLVDMLAAYGERQLEDGSTGTGTSHLRAAKQIHGSTHVIHSGAQAASQEPLVGEVLADKIDQILIHGAIVHDTEAPASPRPRHPYRAVDSPAPIVQELCDHAAVQAANQPLVDALREYGDSHLRGGHRGKGISHLRAARSIRDAQQVITSMAEAKKLPMVGDHVALKINQIFRMGHADSDEDYVPDEEVEGGGGGGDVSVEELGEEEQQGEEKDVVEVEEQELDEEEDDQEGEFGPRFTDMPHPPPLVRDVSQHPAVRTENQAIVDALAAVGEQEIVAKNTGRGVSYLRAARMIQNANEVIQSTAQAKQMALVGDKIAAFIGQVLDQQKTEKAETA